MKLCNFVITILFVFVSGQDEWGLVHFNINYGQLLKCMEENPLWNDIDFDIDPLVRKYIARYLTSRFTYESTTQIDNTIVELIDQIDRGGNIEFVHYPRLRVQFERGIRKIVLNCSEESVSNRESSEYQELPHFVNARDNFEDLMNLILVNWPFPLRTMLSTRVRRSVLRSYAEQALRLLEAYYDGDVLLFEANLRSEWEARAQIFFDGESLTLPYINHLFSLDRNTSYTRDSPNLFIRRRNEDFEVRNPPVLNSQRDTVLDILRIHEDLGDVGTYRRYANRVMSSSDYYFEIHLIRF